MNNFIVCGIPRSGTTLLREIMNRHNNIVCFGETRLFINEYAHRNVPNFFSSSFDIIFDKSGNVAKNSAEVNQDSGIDKFSINRNDPFETLNKAVKSFSSKDNVTHVGEKTPLHLLMVPHILSRWKKVKVIVVLRDMRSTSISIRKRENLQISSELVYYLNMQILKLLQMKHKRIHFVEYCDLCNKPEKTVEQICKFLNLEFSDDMLKVGFDNSSNHKHHFEFAGSYEQRSKNIKIRSVNEPRYCSNIELTHPSYQTKFFYLLKTIVSSLGLNIKNYLTSCSK